MVCVCCQQAECETDGDCPIICEQVGELVDPEGEIPAGWSFDGSQGLKNNAVESCDDCNSEVYPGPDNITDYGINCYQPVCCDGVCQQEVCCYCTCAKRAAGTTFAYFNLDNGCEECCPPGSTWDGEVCADDETNAIVALDSHEGWSQCGDYCIAVGEECPP